MTNKLNLEIIEHDDYSRTEVTKGVYVGGKYTECSISASLSCHITGERTIEFKFAGTTLLSTDAIGIYLHGRIIATYRSGNLNEIPQELPEIINVLRIFKRVFEYDPIGRDMIAEMFTIIKQQIIL